jgi:CRISPR-associated exonuclease Cas4
MSEWESIPITKLVDYLYSPQTVYTRLSYDDLDYSVYYSYFQTEGKMHHKSIDKQDYSTSKHILQGVSIGSEEFGIHGKIDLYNTKSKQLIERKRSVSHIQLSALTQLYAQYYCLIEMGFKVESIKVYSILDKKSYKIPLPTSADHKNLLELIKKIHTTTFSEITTYTLQSEKSIYSTLSL